jgi:RNA polymerase sigma factor (sigma-70 family)
MLVLDRLRIVQDDFTLTADFTVPTGARVAVIGPSGAGKSTVFNLLMRLYDASTGSVAVDGLDVREVTGASLRGQMGLVAQDSALFDDSIANNIALGRIGATRADIEAAAKAANAHDFISTLPGGYDAPAGEMGRNLSGGQRQRVALARAILRGAPILLLDEATSALDAESEAKVQADAMARELNVSRKDVLEMETRLAGHDVSIDPTVDDGEESYSPLAYLASPDENPAQRFEREQTEKLRHDGLAAALENLDERSRHIIKARWLTEGEAATLHELAAQYGVSAERIRQIEARALQKMRAVIPD